MSQFAECKGSVNEEAKAASDARAKDILAGGGISWDAAQQRRVHLQRQWERQQQVNLQRQWEREAVAQAAQAADARAKAADA